MDDLKHQPTFSNNTYSTAKPIVYIVREQVYYDEKLQWSGIEVYKTKDLAKKQIQIKKWAWLLVNLTIDEEEEVTGTSSENNHVTIRLWIQPEQVNY